MTRAEIGEWLSGEFGAPPLPHAAAVRVATPPTRNQRGTQCISSQIGCALDCRFCATTSLGFHRNLDTCEIVEQVACARALLEQEARHARRRTPQSASTDFGTVPSDRVPQPGKPLSAACFRAVTRRMLVESLSQIRMHGLLGEAVGRYAR